VRAPTPQEEVGEGAHPPKKRWMGASTPQGLDFAEVGDEGADGFAGKGGAEAFVVVHVED